MSDLQCAARFLVVAALGDDTVEQLRDQRVAMLYDARPGGPGGSPGGDDAAGVAGRFGVPVTSTEPLGLADLRDREPASIAVLQGLADLHRGETVVVHAQGEPDGWLEVLVDGDGVTVTGHGTSSGR